MIIAVDFDGTICENHWPGVGAPNMKLIWKLIRLRSLGNKVILWTMRTHKPYGDENRDLLQEAVDYCEDHGLLFDGVNEPDPENAAAFGNDSRKIYADIYIDDHNANSCFTEEYLIPFTRNLEAQDIITRS